MKPIKRTIIIASFFISVNAYPQNTFEQKELAEIDKLIKEDNPRSVYTKIRNSTIKFNNVSGYPLKYQLMLKLNNSYVLQQEGKYEEARKSVLNSLDEIQKNKKNIDILNYESLKHIAITRLFYIEKRLGNTAQGLRYINIFSGDMSPVYRKKQMMLFAIAYIELGNYKKGIDILNVHLKDINPALYDWFSELETASTYNTKGDTFIKWYKDTGQKKFLDSAYQNYDNAYAAIKKSAEFSEYSTALYTIRKANIELLKKKYNHSLLLFNQSEKDSSLMSKTVSRESVWIGKAEVYTALRKTDSAFYYINKLYNTSSVSRCTYENILKIYHLLNINYENIGNNRMAYKYAKLSLAEIDKMKIRSLSGNAFLGLYEKQEIQSLSEEVLRKSRIHFIIVLAAILSCFTAMGFYLYPLLRRKKSKAVSKFYEKAAEISSEHPEEKKAINVHVMIEGGLVSKILSKLDTLEQKKKFLSHDFKLSNIARQINTNTAYLSHIINEHKGNSFSEYVHDLRISYVIKELQENPVFRKYTIQTISEEVGYKSATTFVKAFKDRTQLSPSDYIKTL